jgi:hypothetical protein
MGVGAGVSGIGGRVGRRGAGPVGDNVLFVPTSSSIGVGAGVCTTRNVGPDVMSVAALTAAIRRASDKMDRLILIDLLG